jgi:hypothetical protein
MIRAAAVLLLLGCAGTTPPAPGPLDDPIARGVRFLIASQSPDGSWGTGRDTTDFDIMASVPGSLDAFRVGTTALAVLALREAGEKTASRRGLEYLSTYEGLRRATTMEIYNVWGHTFALLALARAFRDDRVDAYRTAAERHLRSLQSYETYCGGWNYYDFDYGLQPISMEPTSFGTAAGLVALHEAKEAGIAVPDGVVRRALSRLKEMKKPDGSFLYGSDFRYAPLHPANREKGSLGRTQACYYALLQWREGGITEAQLRAGLDRLFEEHRFIEIGRKRQYPHEGWYATAGYYYYFGHYFAAKIVERLGSPADLKEKLASFVLPHQEPDGSWWDFKMWDFDKPYGTSFAVMTLLRCR